LVLLALVEEDSNGAEVELGVPPGAVAVERATPRVDAVVGESCRLMRNQTAFPSEVAEIPHSSDRAATIRSPRP
jgi:hypothetical protein